MPKSYVSPIPHRTRTPDGKEMNNALQFARCAAAVLSFSLLASAQLPPSITEYPSAPAFMNADQITTGPDGALWVCGIGIERITTLGVSAVYTVPLTYCNGITAGPDGALWFTGGCCNGPALAR